MEIADRLWEEGERRAAMRHYLIKAILGLQGGRNVGGADLSIPGIEEFTPDLSFLGNDVTASAHVYLQDRGEDVEALQAVYDEAVEAIWRDRFPRSPEAVWGDIHDAVVARLDETRFRNRVSSAGSDLLSSADAERLVDAGDFYDIARRVWGMLKSPSWEDAEDDRITRAEYYLGHIDFRELNERWTARMFRRRGEIRQWYDDEPEALADYEAALKLRERIGVKRVTKQLRKRVNAGGAEVCLHCGARMDVQDGECNACRVQHVDDDRNPSEDRDSHESDDTNSFAHKESQPLSPEPQRTTRSGCAGIALFLIVSSTLLL